MKMMYQVILLILIMEEDLPNQKNPILLKPLAVMLSKITKNSVHLIEEQLQISNLSWLNAQQDAVLRNNIKLWVWVSIQKNLWFVFQLLLMDLFHTKVVLLVLVLQEVEMNILNPKNQLWEKPFQDSPNPKNHISHSKLIVLILLNLILEFLMKPEKYFTEEELNLE